MKLSSVSSAVSRTSPIAFRPAASNTFLIRVGKPNAGDRGVVGQLWRGSRSLIPFRFGHAFTVKTLARYSGMPFV